MVRNNDKGHIRHIQIKFNIIIIAQYILAENVPFIVQFYKSCNLKKRITQPLNIDCRIANNTLCIVCEHLIRSPITGRFLKWCLLAINKGNNNMALFEVSSPLKTKSTPHSGLGQSLILTGCISGLTYFTWSRRFKTVLRSIPPLLADPCY